jgi:RsiW-degrading membrane proteinase PrsW (M82 family)
MLAAAPLLALIIYLYFRNRADRAFAQTLVRSFMAGIAGIIILVIAEYLTSTFNFHYLTSLKRILFYSFITVGGSSELGKFIVLRYYIIPKKQARKPIDAITFSIMTSLGFSTVAMVLFMMDFSGIRSNFPPTLYAVFIVPANILFSVIMGFFVGMAQFLKARIVFSMTGLFGSAIFHGIFNFCMLTMDYKLLSLFSFGSMLIVLVLVLKAALTNPEQSYQ